MARAGAVIIKGNAVALIKRVREEKEYYVFPGGQIENCETIEEACIREIKEELGLDVSIDRKIAEVFYNDDFQYYFLCNVVSGVFGTGAGEEYFPEKPKSRGIHEPVWMNINELPNLTVLPACICEALISCCLNGPIKFIELDDGTYKKRKLL